MAIKMDNRLHNLCKLGKVQDVEEFMDTCDNLPLWLSHTAGVYGYTPMHEAANSNRPGVLKLLLRGGADVNCRANMHARSTPLHLAAFNGHEECVRVLMENNADITIADGYGRTPLQLAEYGKKHAVIKLLMDTG